MQLLARFSSDLVLERLEERVSGGVSIVSKRCIPREAVLIYKYHFAPELNLNKEFCRNPGVAVRWL